MCINYPNIQGCLPVCPKLFGRTNSFLTSITYCYQLKSNSAVTYGFSNDTEPMVFIKPPVTAQNYRQMQMVEGKGLQFIVLRQ